MPLGFCNIICVLKQPLRSAIDCVIVVSIQQQISILFVVGNEIKMSQSNWLENKKKNNIEGQQNGAFNYNKVSNSDFETLTKALIFSWICLVTHEKYVQLQNCWFNVFANSNAIYKSIETNEKK